MWDGGDKDRLCVGDAEAVRETLREPVKDRLDAKEAVGVADGDLRRVKHRGADPCDIPLSKNVRHHGGRLP